MHLIFRINMRILGLVLNLNDRKNKKSSMNYKILDPFVGFHCISCGLLVQNTCLIVLKNFHMPTSVRLKIRKFGLFLSLSGKMWNMYFSFSWLFGRWCMMLLGLDYMLENRQRYYLYISELVTLIYIYAQVYHCKLMIVIV